MQFDPCTRLIEKLPETGTLAITSFCAHAPEESGAMMIRYDIGDEGDVMAYEDMLQFVGDRGFAAGQAATSEGFPERCLPFVWVFGRKHWTVSLFGANVYVENVMLGVEQPEVAGHATGKFVLSVKEDDDADVRLAVVVELTAKASSEAKENDSFISNFASVVAESIRVTLCQANPEFSTYVPPSHQLPAVDLRMFGDPTYFPLGTKHRYIIPT
eukprot:TRINITY_DN4972_c0_g1_i2.p1 TRINITY_DN4972_c0_g1~~TRINITY_DN4972_c0_g1_i2.p1  ORF type:complete len:214 (+),score=51.00 TRINITY_DN4972_c0_g1_i2:617-1258(+)